MVDICKTYQLRILNGRFLGDSLGYYTFFNSNGKSMIDYMLTSTDLFHDVEYFNILPPNELSDHCLLSTGIKNNCSGIEIGNNTTVHKILPGTFIWDDEKRERFTISLVDDESISDILKVNELLDDPTNKNINDLVSKIGNIYKNAAKKVLRNQERENGRKPNQSKNG